ncbi:MAG: HIT domain-containing protein [Nitrospinota bacterium]
MKSFWAPWRMEYILRDKPDASAPVTEGSPCVFCDLLQDADGPGNLVLYRGEAAYVVMNKFPYSNGHLLVVPIRHEKNFESLSDIEGAEIFRLGQKCITVLRQTLKADGFNMGLNLGRAAGAGIAPHLHFHVVPRWENDHNFMAVLGDVRIIPEHIQTTYKNLKRTFSENL